MTGTGAYIEKMTAVNPLMEPVAVSAIRALALPAGSEGLDAGCGIGLDVLRLVEAVGPGGHVTGLDLSKEHLSTARLMAAESGLSERISFKHGDVTALPFENAAFDWVWSSCCVGYAGAIEPLAALKELVRVVKTGGVAAILVWSSEKLLPGYPLLEAHLNATSSGIAPFAKHGRPELHFMRALAWFQESGLIKPLVRTFVRDIQAPLTEEIREALITLFQMRWPGAEPELPPEMRPLYRKLCTPGSPEFILNQADYYAFFTCTMFSGVKRSSGG